MKNLLKLNVIATIFIMFSFVIVSAETIWVPVGGGSGLDRYINKIEGNVVVIENGEKHILKSVAITGIEKRIGRYLDMNLSNFIDFTLDEIILNPNYDYVSDKHDYHCLECKDINRIGRYNIFVPLDSISKIVCKKKDIAKIYFKERIDPIFVYFLYIEISGIEDLGGFGKAEYKKFIFGSDKAEIIFPDNIPKAKIEKKSDESFTVTMDSGKKRKLVDFRPRVLTAVSNGLNLPLKVDKISRIKVIKDANNDSIFSIRLKTGDERNFTDIINPSADGPWNLGIAGKGDNWYENIEWENIKEIEFYGEFDRL